MAIPQQEVDVEKSFRLAVRPWGQGIPGMRDRVGPPVLNCYSPSRAPFNKRGVLTGLSSITDWLTLWKVMQMTSLFCSWSWMVRRSERTQAAGPQAVPQSQHALTTIILLWSAARGYLLVIKESNDYKKVNNVCAFVFEIGLTNSFHLCEPQIQYQPTKIYSLSSQSHHVVRIPLSLHLYRSSLSAKALPLPVPSQIFVTRKTNRWRIGTTRIMIMIKFAWEKLRLGLR